MISETAAVWCAFIFAILLIGFFVAMLFAGKFSGVASQGEFKEIISNERSHENHHNMTDAVSSMLDNDEYVSKKYLACLEQIESSLIGFFGDQIWKAAVIAIVVWLVFVHWFSYVGTRFISFFAFFWGIVATSCVAFIVFKFSSPILSRYMIDSNVGKASAYGSGWISSAAVSSCMVSLVILFYLIFVPLSKFVFIDKYEGDSETITSIKDDYNTYWGEGKKTPVDILNFYYALISYGLGVITTAIFLRDTPKTLGLGLVLGNELTGKLVSQHGHTENITIVF